MLEVIFLFVLALIWIIFAVIQDAKTTEVANWLNFSLVTFALGFRFFYSLFSSSGFGFFYQGVIGFAIFYVLGNLLYNAKMFAGGDAKMFFSLGAVLPIYGNFISNLDGLFSFLFAFFVIGAVYSIITSLVLCIHHFSESKKEFKKQFREKKKFVIWIIFVAVLMGLAGLLISNIFFYLAIFFFVIPYLYLYAKAVDEAAMIRNVDAVHLRDGDWLYKDVKVGKKTIKANWDGLSKQEITLLRKHKKKVLIRSGVQFNGVFFISTLIYFYSYLIGLRYSFW